MYTVLFQEIDSGLQWKKERKKRGRKHIKQIQDRERTSCWNLQPGWNKRKTAKMGNNSFHQIRRKLVNWLISLVSFFMCQFYTLCLQTWKHACVCVCARVLLFTLFKKILFFCFSSQSGEINCRSWRFPKADKRSYKKLSHHSKGHKLETNKRVLLPFCKQYAKSKVFSPPVSLKTRTTVLVASLNDHQGSFFTKCQKEAFGKKQTDRVCAAIKF